MISTNQTVSGLGYGTYTCKVFDKNWCFEIVVIIFLPPVPIYVEIWTTSYPTCQYPYGGSLTANPSGGAGYYTYKWFNSSSLIPFSTNRTVSGLGPGTYTVKVFDKNWCFQTASVTFPALSCIHICTLTQGYWKTHRPGSTGPAPDLTWTTCGCYTNATFFNCPHNWIWYLDQPAHGDSIIISAKQWIAAYLNLAKADLDPLKRASWYSINDQVEACFFDLYALYSSSCSVGASSGSPPKLRPKTTQSSDSVLSCASLLDTFNNGGIAGVPHCS